MRFVLLLLAAAVATHPRPLVAQPAVYPGPSFTRTEVAPGVHAFVFDNALGDAANPDGSTLAIINDADVIIVDAQWTPTTTRRVLAEIRKLTDKPVRYVVNTHWHGDHWLGNQVYREAFHGVEFIAHRNTLTDMQDQEVPSLAGADTSTTAIIASLKKLFAGGKRRDGSPFTRDDSVLVTRQMAALEWSIPAAREIRPVLPTMTITDSLVLHRGARTIVIRYLGRGNTRGDLSVWLPDERVLATGDLLVNPGPYSFGSFLGEWIQTLGALRRLPATVIVPGHGAIQRDWAYFDLFAELLSFTLAEAKKAVAKGMDLQATRDAVDLKPFRERFARGDVRIVRAFDAFFIAPAVERAWLEARGELDKPPREQ